MINSTLRFYFIYCHALFLRPVLQKQTYFISEIGIQINTPTYVSDLFFQMKKKNTHPKKDHNVYCSRDRPTLGQREVLMGRGRLG